MSIISESYIPITLGAVIISSAVLGFTIFRKSSNRQRTRAPTRTISHVIVYPIKGCKGVERYSASLSENGLAGDREYCIIVREPKDSKQWTTLSQNKCPKLATIAVSIPTAGSHLTVSAPNSLSCIIKGSLEGPQYDVNFWESIIRVVDQGDEASRWFSDYLGLDCRLARILPGEHRRAIESGVVSTTSLFYHTPILLMSRESIESISEAVGTPINYNRFRPNIIIKDVGFPFEEDLISSVSSKDWTMDGFELCVRCSYPGVNQETGILDPLLVGKFRAIRNRAHIKMHPKYEKMAKDWKDNDYMVGVYMKVRPGASSKIFVGQEIIPEF